MHSSLEKPNTERAEVTEEESLAQDNETILSDVGQDHAYMLSCEALAEKKG